MPASSPLPSRVIRRLWVALTFFVAGAWGLGACQSAPSRGGSDAGVSAAGEPAASPMSGFRGDSLEPAAMAGSLLSRLARCQIHQDGFFVDFGRDAEDRARISRGLVEAPLSEHEGSGFRLISNTVDIPFLIDEALPASRVQIRVAGDGGVRGALGGRSLGTLRVRSRRDLAEARVLSFPVTAPDLAPGIHHLVLQPTGSRAGRAVEVDWALISPTSPQTGFRTPSQEALVRSVALGGDPRSAIVLSNDASVRCPVQLDGEARLSLAVGYLGAGEGLAEVIVRRPGLPPEALFRQVVRGAAERWLPLSLDLTPFGPDAVLEFRARSSDSSDSSDPAVSPDSSDSFDSSDPAGSSGDVGRVLFADPSVHEPEQPAQSEAAPLTDLAIVIVAEGFEPGDAASWQRLESLSWLAERGATFTDYRLPSPVSSASFASLLTGLSPDAHLLNDPGSRLADDLDTLATRVSAVGGQSAMFTGVPTTFPSFGFDRGWDDYVPLNPVDDESATAPLLRATQWLEAALEGAGTSTGETPRLVLVHLRGGHPPWDLDRASAAELEPPDYAGPIQPRRGGIILEQLRRHDGRLLAADLVRLEALRRNAAVDLDAALKPLLTMLRDRGRLADAMIVVAGGSPPGSAIPFSAAGSLRESQLHAPLLVKFPRGTDADRVRIMVTTTDLYQTTADALGVPIRPRVGEDLFCVATTAPSGERRTVVATLGDRYAARSGPWLLRGSGTSAPQLCALDSDPECEMDRFAADPIAAQVIWADVWAQRLAAERARRGRQPLVASPDPATLSALTAWGM